MNTGLTVLLVDDEPSTLVTLSTSIHWQQYGINTILTASDGNNALEIMSEQKVDLLITDIEMPHMDGLTLLSEVRVLYPETHLILLTAYGEFEYARKAIKLGVENYLLKPLHIEELEETIDKALDNIYTNQKISKELFRNNIFSRWLKGNISDAELSERATLLDVNLYLPEYCIVSVCKKKPGFSLTNYCKACTEKLLSVYETHYFCDKQNRYIFIIGGSNIIIEDLLDYFVEQATQMSLTHLIALSVVNPVPDITDLPKSYQTACTLVDCADLSNPDMVILTQNQSAVQTENKLVQELHMIFNLHEEDLRSNSFCKLADELFMNMEGNSLKEIPTLLSHSLSRLFSQEFPNHPEAQEQLLQRIHLFTTFNSKETFSIAVIELLEYSYLLFNYYFEQLSPIIQSAISYIHNHYSEGISIKEFCIKSKVSTPYLGYLFKKETGLFFNNYLTQHRICASIQLLLDTDLKINDIALAVGFSSPSYYISCFKKQTGLSPIKYRLKQF